VASPDVNSLFIHCFPLFGYVAIKTVKNMFFAYCFLFLVCVIRARFIYTSKILLADRMQSKIFENNRYLIKFY